MTTMTYFRDLWTLSLKSEKLSFSTYELLMGLARYRLYKISSKANNKKLNLDALYNAKPSPPEFILTVDKYFWDLIQARLNLTLANNLCQIFTNNNAATDKPQSEPEGKG